MVAKGDRQAAMKPAVRAILFNSDEGYACRLRESLLGIRSLRIVAELDELSLLPQATSQFPADVLIVHLDPMAMLALEVVSQVVRADPRMPVLAISENTQGDVLMQAMKAGVKRFLVKPLDAAELQEAVEQIAAMQPLTARRGTLISVMGSTGGAGATFLATNLAVELAELIGGERKVALLDFDFRFGQVATILDLEAQFTVADLCSTPEQLDPGMIERVLVRHGSGVHVLARPHHFSEAEAITAAHCANVLSTMQEMFEYVVIDGPVRSDPGGRLVLDAADLNLMVVQLLVTSVRSAQRMLEELVGQGFNTGRIQFVCNRVGRESAHLDVGQIEKSLKSRMFHQLPSDWQTASSAINLGRPLREGAFARTKLRQALRELAMKIHCPEALAKPAKGMGLVGRLLRPRPQVAPAPTGAT